MHIGIDILSPMEQTNEPINYILFASNKSETIVPITPFINIIMSIFASGHSNYSSYMVCNTGKKMKVQALSSPMYPNNKIKST